MFCKVGSVPLFAWKFFMDPHSGFHNTGIWKLQKLLWKMQHSINLFLIWTISMTPLDWKWAEKNVIDENTGTPIFEIEEETGVIKTAVCCLDREKTPDYSIQVGLWFWSKNMVTLIIKTAVCCLVREKTPDYSIQVGLWLWSKNTGTPIFKIEEETGVIKTAVCCLDREKTPDYSIQVGLWFCSEKMGTPIFEMEEETGVIKTAVCCLDREKTPDYSIQVGLWLRNKINNDNMTY